MNDTFLAVLFTTFIAFLAWAARFAIKEYEIYKKMKVPSSIFKYGLLYYLPFIVWTASAHKVYERIFPFLAEDKIEEANKSLTSIMADWSTVYIFGGLLFFMWFYSLSISRLAEFIHKEKKNAASQ